MPDTSVRIWSLSLTILVACHAGFAPPRLGVEPSFPRRASRYVARQSAALSPLCSVAASRASGLACVGGDAGRKVGVLMGQPLRLLLHHPHLQFKLLLALLPGGFCSLIAAELSGDFMA